MTFVWIDPLVGCKSDVKNYEKIQASGMDMNVR